MRLAVNHKLQCSASAAFMRAVGVTSLEFFNHVHFVELERTLVVIDICLYLSDEALVS